MRNLVSRRALAYFSLLMASSGLSQIPVPGFQLGDEEKYQYFISHFDVHGYQFDSASVDENGLLYFILADQTFVDGEEVGWEHSYIYSQDRVTGEKRYGFDLENFPLLGLLQSLGISQRRLPGPGTAVRSPSMEGLLTAEVSDPLYADIVVPYLQGENLTFAQTLDQLRDASGCDVIQVDDRLIIDWCG